MMTQLTCTHPLDTKSSVQELAQIMGTPTLSSVMIALVNKDGQGCWKLFEKRET